MVKQAGDKVEPGDIIFLATFSDEDGNVFAVTRAMPTKAAAESFKDHLPDGLKPGEPLELLIGEGGYGKFVHYETIFPEVVCIAGPMFDEAAAQGEVAFLAPGGAA